ncbi:hypothetical protein ACHAWF_012694 [Thalassiosira exigua]
MALHWQVILFLRIHQYNCLAHSNLYSKPAKFTSAMAKDRTTSFSHVMLDDQFALADGVKMGVTYFLPTQKGRRRPPLVFLHGSFHSAWCWAEHFMPYFAHEGYPCVALSLRGTGEEEASKVKIDQHVDDVLYFLEQLNRHVTAKKKMWKSDDAMRLFFEFISNEFRSGCNDGYIAPVIIAHSFGGLVAMKLLERLSIANGQTTKETPLMSTMALLNSVPPSGITKMSLRALRRNPAKGWRIMRGLAMKRAVSDANLCRSLFFDQDIPPDELEKYLARFERDSKVTMDMRDLTKKLPILKSDSNGRSTCLDALLHPPLVLGGEDDYIVDSDAVEETARFLSPKSTDRDKHGCNLVLVKDAVHDVMLARCWRDVAKEIELWLSGFVSETEDAHLPQ